MKKVIITLSMFMAVIVAPANGQHLALWMQQEESGDPYFIPWVYHTNSVFSIEVRHNFDHSRTTGVFFGREIPAGDVTITPMIGQVAGRYNAVSFQTRIVYRDHEDAFRVFSLEQAAVGESLQLRHYMDILTRLERTPIFLGFTGQVTYMEHTTGNAGPTVLLDLPPLSIRFWPALMTRGVRLEGGKITVSLHAAL